MVFLRLGGFVLVAVILLLTSLCSLRRQTRSAWILNSSFHVRTATSIRKPSARSRAATLTGRSAPRSSRQRPPFGRPLARCALPSLRSVQCLRRRDSASPPHREAKLPELTAKPSTPFQSARGVAGVGCWNLWNAQVTGTQWERSPQLSLEYGQTTGQLSVRAPDHRPIEWGTHHTSWCSAAA
jgi:hypothetical protein